MQFSVLDYVHTKYSNYAHVICPDDDSTYLLHHEDMVGEHPVFKVDSSAVVYDLNGKRIGHFRTGTNNNWVFYSMSGQATEFNTSDLLRAEAKLFTAILEGKLHV